MKLVIKNLPANAGGSGDMGSIQGRSPGGGNDNLFQYYCLENSMDREAWQATVQGVAKSWTWLSNWAHQSPFSDWLVAKTIEYKG